MNEEKDTKALVPSPVRPLLSPQAAAEAWNTFEELKKRLLKDADYQLISGRRAICKSGFRKLSVVFDISDRIIEQERTERPDDSFYWRIVVEVQAPNGRTCSGVGICDSREQKRAHVEHDVYATCHTRAKNRAISDMVAGGVVSAEEIGEVPFEEVESEPEPETPKPKQKDVLGKVTLKRGHSWDQIFAEFGPEIQIRQQELGELWTFESAAIVFARERGFVKKD